MVTVELEFHAAGFCVSRLPVAIPLDLSELARGLEATGGSVFGECWF